MNYFCIYHFLHHKNENIKKKFFEKHDIIINQTWLSTMIVWRYILHVVQVWKDISHIIKYVNLLSMKYEVI